MSHRTIASGIVVLLGCFAAGAEEADTLPSAVAIVEEVLETSGIDAAKSRFGGVLKAPDEYEIDGSAFVALGHRLQQEGEFEKAVAVYAMAAEAFPEATWIQRRIAATHFASGDETAAIETMEALNSLDDQKSLGEYLAADHPKILETTAEVIAAHLEATGGADAWRKIRTMEVTLSGHDSRGKLFRLVRQYKRPLHYRQQVEGSGRAMVTDGTRVWRVSDEGWKEIEDTAFTYMASVDGWFLDPEARGVEYQMLGFEIFHDAPVYRLRRTFANERTEELIFSAENGYLTETFSEYPWGRAVMYSYASHWDYREHGGIKLPHVFIRSVGQLGPPHGVVVEKVAVNLPLDDALFSPPLDADGS